MTQIGTMRDIKAIITSLSLAALLGGCASLSMNLPNIDEPAVETEKNRVRSAAFEKFTVDNNRLQTLAGPILSANAPLCKKTRSMMPVQTAKLTYFPKALRPLAKDTYGYTNREPRIIFAPARFIGEEIIGADGKAISARSASAQTHIKPRQGLKGDAPKARPQCDFPVRLKYTPAINAYANGRSITVTTGMMDFASDAELALIIGHELAHNTQGHVRKILQNTVLGLGRGNFARKFESEADYVGLYYSARAGYEISDVADFWRRLGLESVKHLDTPKTHPISSERYVRLRAALTEIKTKQDAGLPLEPNLK